MAAPGYYSEQEFALITAEEVPSSATFRAEVRETYAGAVMATLTSAAGIERVSSTLETTGENAGKWSTIIRLKFSAEMSVGWSGKSLHTDLVRTDIEPEEYLYIRLHMTWPQVFTRGQP